MTRHRRTRKTFWLRVPDCPRGRKVSFGADYGFLGGSTITKRWSVGCSRFLDLPSAHRKCEILSSGQEVVSQPACAGAERRIK